MITTLPLYSPPIEWRKGIKTIHEMPLKPPFTTTLLSPSACEVTLTDNSKITKKLENNGSSYKYRLRRVSFDLESNLRHEVRNLEEISQDEIRATWYVKSDYVRIRKEIVVAIKLMEQDCPEKGDICYRGLEYCMGSHKFAARKKAYAAVMIAQRLNMDPEVTGNLYSGHTKKCIIDAHNKGLSDASSVKRLWSSKSDACPKLPTRKRTFSKAA